MNLDGSFKKKLKKIMIKMDKNVRVWCRTRVTGPRRRSTAPSRRRSTAWRGGTSPSVGWRTRRRTDATTPSPRNSGRSARGSRGWARSGRFSESTRLNQTRPDSKLWQVSERITRLGEEQWIIRVNTTQLNSKLWLVSESITRLDEH